MKEKFLEILRKVNREGIEELINFLENLIMLLIILAKLGKIRYYMITR